MSLVLLEKQIIVESLLKLLRLRSSYTEYLRALDIYIYIYKYEYEYELNVKLLKLKFFIIHIISKL